MFIQNSSLTTRCVKVVTVCFAIIFFISPEDGEMKVEGGGDDNALGFMERGK